MIRNREGWSYLYQPLDGCYHVAHWMEDPIVFLGANPPQKTPEAFAAEVTKGYHHCGVMMESFRKERHCCTYLEEVCYCIMLGPILPSLPPPPNMPMDPEPWLLFIQLHFQYHSVATLHCQYSTPGPASAPYAPISQAPEPLLLQALQCPGPKSHCVSVHICILDSR